MPARSAHRARSLLGPGLALAAAAWLSRAHLSTAVRAEIALDELQYAHGGWSIARGEAIYRDFFEHHLPLLHQVLALLWDFLADDPTHVLTLRLLMLPAFGVAIAAATALNRSCGGLATWTTPVLLLMIAPLSGMAIQLRPGVLGAALFLVSLALLDARRPGQRLRALLAGACAGAALWATLKAAVYGLVFVAALGVDLATARRDASRPRLLGDPAAFVFGAAAVLAAALLHLAATSGLAAFWRWGLVFNLRHQEVYPGFGWMPNALQVLEKAPWLPLLAAVGVATTLAGLRAPASPPPAPAGSAHAAPGGDALLLAALATTAVSFTWQTAPYLYSLIPCLLVLGVFAARGLAAIVVRLRQPDPGGSAHPAKLLLLGVLALLALGEVHRSLVGLERIGDRTNDRQLATLARLGELTAPDDPVFHVWGGQVARPSPHFFHFLEAATEQLEEERLRRELVPALVERGVTAYLHHPLMERLPAPLRSYLLESFLPLDEDLWIYGRRFPVRDGIAEGTFPAVRTDPYFVWPPAAVGAGSLWIDGEPAPTPVVRLGRGAHHIRFEGPGEEIFVVWLPRDGRPFPPRPDLRPGA